MSSLRNQGHPTSVALANEPNRIVGVRHSAGVGVMDGCERR